MNNLRYASLDMVFMYMSTKFHSYKYNIKQAMFTEYIFNKNRPFILLVLPFNIFTK